MSWELNLSGLLISEFFYFQTKLYGLLEIKSIHQWCLWDFCVFLRCFEIRWVRRDDRLSEIRMSFKQKIKVKTRKLANFLSLSNFCLIWDQTKKTKIAFEYFWWKTKLWNTAQNIKVLHSTFLKLPATRTEKILTPLLTFQ